MLKDGVLDINEHKVHVTDFEEATLLSMGLGAVERVRNGERVSYALQGVNVEGESCDLLMCFDCGKLDRILLSPFREFGPYWKDKLWEQSYLFMEEEVYAEWLSKVLEQRGPVKSAEFPWGRVRVSVDHQKGWDTSIVVVPHRQQ